MLSRRQLFALAAGAPVAARAAQPSRPTLFCTLPCERIIRLWQTRYGLLAYSEDKRAFLVHEDGSFDEVLNPCPVAEEWSGPKPKGNRIISPAELLLGW
jgi:hypothetical protein